MKVEVVRSSK